MKLRLIRRILNEYSTMISGISTVIILKLLLEIFEREDRKVITTKTNLMRKYEYSQPSIANALYSANKLKILKVEKEDNGCVGVVITVHENLLSGD